MVSITSPRTRAGGAVLGFVLVALPALSVDAQDTPFADSPELVTDRPDQTESAAVVPAGFVQVESGVTLSGDEEGVFETRLFEGPGTLVRIGLGHRTELRLGWDGWIEEDVDSGHPRVPNRTTDGFGDGELGAKVRLRDEAGALPQAALLAGVSLPVGDDEVSSDRFDPSLRLAFDHTLTERLGLAYNVGMEWSSEEEDPGGGRDTASRLVYTVALGTSLTGRLGAFVELFGAEPVDAPPGSELSADGGFTYLVRPNLQLDLAGGAGLNEDTPDWFVGAGVSYRWPR